MQRELGVRRGCNVQHGEVFVCKGIPQATKSQQDQEELPSRRRLRNRHQRGVPHCGAIDGQASLHHRHTEREN